MRFEAPSQALLDKYQHYLEGVVEQAKKEVGA
jgi:hypothetical protein